MTITREFCPGDRYTYDFGLCSYANGCGLPKCRTGLTGNVRAVGHGWGHDTRYAKT